MRMLVTVRLHRETFNAAVKDGSAREKLEAIVDELNPEAVYFTEKKGGRCVVMVVDLEEPSRIPALAEPWYLTFNAEVDIRIVMGPEDLQKAGLESIGEKWG